MERVMSKEIQRNQLKPGDHIYSRRPDDLKSDGIDVIHQADNGYRMLRTTIENFLAFKTDRVGRSVQAVGNLVVAFVVFFICSNLRLSLIWRLLWALSAVHMVFTFPNEFVPTKKLGELSFQANLKNMIFLTCSALYYTGFGIPECIALFCWSIFHRNFNFRNWLLFNKISMEKLNAGDHIYSWRGFVYTHHGIYAGDRKVIHAVRGGSPKMCSSSSSSPFYSSNIYVESIDIDEFVSGGELYLYEYGVNLGYFVAKFRGGACTLASSDPPEDVLHRANFLLRHKSRAGKKRKRGEIPSKSKVIGGAYDLFRSNCEDFAIYCKTSLAVSNYVGAGRSGQISCLFAVVGFLISFETPFLSTDLIRVFAGYCIYSAFRIISDTKCLRRSYRIPVEDLADFAILYGGISTSKHVRLVLVLFSTHILWSLRCRVFGGGTECHIFLAFQGPIAGILFLIAFF